MNKENLNNNEEISTSGFDAITKTFEKIYKEQKEPLHYRPIISYELGGKDPLDGVSVYRGNGYYHFVTYGFSELYEKESEDKEYSGFGFELTFKLKMNEKQINNTKDEDASDDEVKSAVGFLQQLAGYVFESGSIFNPYQYIWTKQKEGIDSKQKSKITGFITIPDEAGEINTPNGKVIFVELVGATDSELNAIYDKKITVKELAQKIGTDITDYNRASLL
ncbi:suppressor of fused domain protein [Brachyspira murdochii]|uniref:Branched-chain alpha-keto acid dehydrogenase subunit E2 n=1 Tax=Brachyspira murdochii TaxID=84378 RepID=A0ABX5B4Z4_9SPIR|nr:suppressor of fused domain protein [Brachyspira murdochii]PPS22215.1 branched-chain alpha-keto acid dehydrogenase subunit E2 [Brachyspira murdochii]